MFALRWAVYIPLRSKCLVCMWAKITFCQIKKQIVTSPALLEIEIFLHRFGVVGRSPSPVF